MHASFNTFANRIVARCFPLRSSTSTDCCPSSSVFDVLALIVIVATRGRLGDQHYREAQKAEMAGAPAV